MWLALIQVYESGAVGGVGGLFSPFQPAEKITSKDYMRFRIGDLAFLANRLRNHHSIISYSEVSRPILQSSVCMYVRDMKEVEDILCEIHNDIYSIINKNGLTFDELGGVQREKQGRGEGRDCPGSVSCWK